MQTLDDCIKEIRNDHSIATWKEAQVKDWIIRPILDLLGWGRREIIKNPNTLKEPQKLKNGLYIEYQYSKRAPEFAKRLLKKYGYDDPEILQIKY